jgi:hypothetical protein
MDKIMLTYMGYLPQSQPNPDCPFFNIHGLYPQYVHQDQSFLPG